MLPDPPTSILVLFTKDSIQRKSSSVLIFFAFSHFIVRSHRLSVGTWNTNGVPITNNVIYHTYQSAIVVTGKNNIVSHNLVGTVYWSGTAEPELAEFNTNNDGAIMSRDAVSVVMKVGV